MKKPKFNAASVNNETTIFDELLTCYKSTESYFFVKTDTPTHIRHLWRTIFLSAAWAAIAFFLIPHIDFLPDGVKIGLLFSVIFILPALRGLKRYVYYKGCYIPLNIYRRKLIENFISTHTTDYPKLANQLLQICKDQNNSDSRAISIAFLGSLVGTLAMVFNCLLLYIYDGYKELLIKNNCPLYEPQALEVLGKIIYILIIPILIFIFFMYLPELKKTRSDKMRIISKAIQELLLEREFRDEK